MKIMDYLSAGSKIEDRTVTKNQVSSSGMKFSFDSYLQTSDRRDNRTRNNNDIEEYNSRESEKTRSSRASDSKRNARNASRPEKDAVDRTKEVDKSSAAKDDPDEELAKEVAAILGLSVQELMAMLSKLDIKLDGNMRPEDIVALTQAALGAESAVDLLWNADAAKAIEKISEALRNWRNAQGMTETGAGLTEFGAIQLTDEAGDFDDGNMVWRGDGKRDAMSVKAGKAEEKTVAGLVKSQSVVMQGATAEIGTTDGFTARQGFQGSYDTMRQSEENVVDSHGIPAMINFNEVSGEQFINVKQTIAQGRSTTETVEVVRQIIDQMKVDVRMDTTELRLTLKPESLGEVTMRVITQNGIVTAQFFAESQRVKEIIEASLNDLKNALNERGVEVSDMAAFVKQDNRESADNGRDMYEGRTLSDMRVTRIMNRNMVLETAEIEESLELVATDTAGNPLEVNIRA